MSIVKDSLTAFSARLLSVPLILAAEVFIARLLGPEGKGIYQLIVSFLGVSVLIGNLGVGQSIVYHMGQKEDERSVLISTVATLALGLGLTLFCILMVFASPLQASFLRGLKLTWIIVAAAFIPLELVNWFFTFVLLGLRKIWWFSHLAVVRRCLIMVFLVAFVWMFGGGVVGGIYAYLAAAAATALIAFTVVSRQEPFGLGLNLRVAGRLIRFGSVIHVGYLSRSLLLRLDVFLVNYFMGAASVGFYSVALGMVELLWYLPNAFAMVLFQRVSAGDGAEPREMTSWVCRHMVFFSLMGSFGLFVFGRFLISVLFKARFLGALTPMYYLLPGAVAFGVYEVLSSDILGRGKPLPYAGISTAALGVNVVLNVLLIPSLGLIGAALASSVSYILASLLMLIVYLKVSRSGALETLMIRSSDLKIIGATLAKMTNLRAFR